MALTANEREIYLELRRGAREILRSEGIKSNPAVGDEWIINQLRYLANLPNVEDYQDRSEDDFTLFQNSLVQIIIDSGGHILNENNHFSTQSLLGKLASQLS